MMALRFYEMRFFYGCLYELCTGIDELMDNIPYDEWISYITSLLHEYNITDGLVAELGCGTGTITEGLAAAGYDMIGIDVSPDMLEIANEKKIANGFSSIMYLQQI